MKLESLGELYFDQLCVAYWVEKELVDKLPDMAEKAYYPELKQCFETHLDQTRQQVQRLEECFRTIGRQPETKKSKGMDGILDEGKDYLKDEDAEPATHDAALITCAQRVEHYEIALYGTLRTYAELLGFNRAAEFHEQTLEEEKAADRMLNQTAIQIVNVDSVRAAGGTAITE